MWKDSLAESKSKGYNSIFIDVSLPQQDIRKYVFPSGITGFWFSQEDFFHDFAYLRWYRKFPYSYQLQRSSPAEDCWILIPNSQDRRLSFPQRSSMVIVLPLAGLIQIMPPQQGHYIHYSCKVWWLSASLADQSPIASTFSPVEWLIFPTESQKIRSVIISSAELSLSSPSRRFSLHFACSGHYIASSKSVAFPSIWSITPWKFKHMPTKHKPIFVPCAKDQNCFSSIRLKNPHREYHFINPQLVSLNTSQNCL